MISLRKKLKMWAPSDREGSPRQQTAVTRRTPKIISGQLELAKKSMNYCNFPHGLKSTSLWEQAGAVRTSSRSEPSSEPHICALVTRCLSTTAGDASHTWAPSLPTSSFLNFTQDCQYGAHGRAGSHRATGPRASLGAAQGEEICLHPKARQVPDSTIFLKKYHFSMKLLHGCEWYSSTIMRIFKHEEKPNTFIHPPK